MALASCPFCTRSLLRRRDIGGWWVLSPIRKDTPVALAGPQRHIPLAWNRCQSASTCGLQLGSLSRLLGAGQETGDIRESQLPPGAPPPLVFFEGGREGGKIARAFHGVARLKPPPVMPGYPSPRMLYLLTQLGKQPTMAQELGPVRPASPNPSMEGREVPGSWLWPGHLEKSEPKGGRSFYFSFLPLLYIEKKQTKTTLKV